MRHNVRNSSRVAEMNVQSIDEQHATDHVAASSFTNSLRFCAIAHIGNVKLMRRLLSCLRTATRNLPGTSNCQIHFHNTADMPLDCRCCVDTVELSGGFAGGLSDFHMTYQLGRTVRCTVRRTVWLEFRLVRPSAVLIIIFHSSQTNSLSNTDENNFTTKRTKPGEISKSHTIDSQ